MESSDIIFSLALLVFLIWLAVVAYRLIFVRSVEQTGEPLTTDRLLHIDDPQLRIDQRPEWERIVRGEKDS